MGLGRVSNFDLHSGIGSMLVFGQMGVTYNSDLPIGRQRLIETTSRCIAVSAFKLLSEFDDLAEI